LGRRALAARALDLGFEVLLSFLGFGVWVIEAKGLGLRIEGFAFRARVLGSSYS